MTSLEIVLQQLAKAINGEALPSLHSPLSGQLVAAIPVLLADHHLMHQLGTQALKLLIDRFNASVNAEREGAIVAQRSLHS